MSSATVVTLAFREPRRFRFGPLCFTSDTRLVSSPSPSIAMRTTSPGFAVYGSGGTATCPVRSHAPTGSVYDECSTAASFAGSRVMSATVAVPSNTDVPPRSIVMRICRTRDIDLPCQHRGRTDRAAAVVDLRLREKERVLPFDAARAHVVPDREGDDLAVRVREDGELGLGDVPGRVLAHADLAAVRDHAPPRSFEEELRPVALVDVLVDRLLGRLFEARLAAAEIA